MTIPIIPNIHQAVYAAASKPDALNMGIWHHSCGVAHCRAGWVVHLGGEAGYALEESHSDSYDDPDTESAALLIYRASDPYFDEEPEPDFYMTNTDAIADMKRRAENEKARGEGK